MLTKASGLRISALQDLVDEYNRKKNLVELQELVEQVQYEEAFD